MQPTCFSEENRIRADILHERARACLQLIFARCFPYLTCPHFSLKGYQPQMAKTSQCVQWTERDHWEKQCREIVSLPDLSNIDQGEVENPQDRHEDHVCTSSYQYKGWSCQAKQGEIVQGAVHVWPIQKPDDCWCIAQSIQVYLPLEILLDILQVQLTWEQPLLSY